MVHPVLSIFSHELRYLLLVSVRTVLQQDFALLTNESARRDHLEALLRRVLVFIVEETVGLTAPRCRAHLDMGWFLLTAR